MQSYLVTFVTIIAIVFGPLWHENCNLIWSSPIILTFQKNLTIWFDINSIASIFDRKLEGWNKSFESEWWCRQVSLTSNDPNSPLMTLMWPFRINIISVGHLKILFSIQSKSRNLYCEMLKKSTERSILSFPSMIYMNITWISNTSLAERKYPYVNGDRCGLLMEILLYTR